MAYQDTDWLSVTPMQRSCRCILQSQPTGLEQQRGVKEIKTFQSSSVKMNEMKNIVQKFKKMSWVHHTCITAARSVIEEAQQLD